MQNTDADPQPPTICRRFVNFMLSMSLRPIPSRPIPIENGSSVHEERSFKSIKKMSSDVVVELRHTYLEGNKASGQASTKDDQVLGNERSIIRKIPGKKEDELSQSPQNIYGFQMQQKTGREYQEKELQDLEILDGTYSETGISVQGSVDLSAGQAMKQKQLRPLMPLSRVDSKINEKSHEFIETRREAMRKSYRLANN
ncbi:hypothetical protein F511_26406 [Dorcoceras hygrometricum]|uniref:Uncharacterized protein n=1 Tax=Dorcoceras hygrometricum TaxID=472368 RepID=A0A2Z7CE43_9LAMI|nr:hypothetical protein F511_26406 [Dorcoceras hygrometricum]